MTSHSSNESHCPANGRDAAPRRAGFSAILTLLLLLLLCLPCFSAPPQSFVVKTVRTAVKQHRLFAELSVSVDDEEGLRNMLKDGAVLALGINIVVERVRSWWGNEEILATDYSSSIMHDPLTRDFLVEQPGVEGIQQHRDKNLTRLLHVTWRQIAIPLTSLERLRIDEPGSHYLIKLNLSLQHAEVPPWLENSMVFWSSNVVPKQSFTLEYALPADMP